MLYEVLVGALFRLGGALLSSGFLLSESAFSGRQFVLEQTVLLLHDSLRFSESLI